jgi:hypothetical protein
MIARVASTIDHGIGPLPSTEKVHRFDAVNGALVMLARIGVMRALNRRHHVTG